MNFGEPNGGMISSLKNFRAPRELKSSAAMARATGHLDMFSVPTSRYWFPLSVFGSGPAKSTDQTLNSLFIGIRPWNYSLLSGLVLFHASQLRTKLEISVRRFGQKNRLAINS